MWADLVVKCEAKRPIADYSHRRPKLIQRKEVGKDGIIDRHRQHFYHGLRTTPVTSHLGCNPPSHAYSPALKNAPPPSYHRKSSPITENVLGAVHVKRFDPSLPAEWHNRQATDVTEQLRFVPPAHAMGTSKADPWYGRARTYVTNPDVDDYSNYQGKMAALKEPEPLQALKAEVYKAREDPEPEDTNWDWSNHGQKLYCLENGRGPAFSQNWSLDEIGIGDGIGKAYDNNRG